MKCGDNISTNHRIRFQSILIYTVISILLIVSVGVVWYVYSAGRTITMYYKDGGYVIKYEMLNALNCKIVPPEFDERRNCFPEEFRIPDTAPNGAKVREIAENAFQAGIYPVKRLYIPDTVEVIHPKAFGTMDDLEYLYIGNRVRSSLEQCFYGGIQLSAIETHNNPFYSTPDNSCLVENSSGTLVLGTIRGVIPNGICRIADSAFYYRAVTSITFPETLTTIGEYAFSRCYVLEQAINLPVSVTTIGANAFAWSAITSLEGGSYTEIPYAMLNACNNLTEFVISPRIKSIDRWGISSFNLRYLYIPASVERMEKEAILTSEKAVICCEISEKPAGWDVNWLRDHDEPYWNIPDSQQIAMKKQTLETWQIEPYDFEAFVCVLEKEILDRMKKEH